MVFRRRGMGMRPVNRIKHVVDIQGAVVAGTSATNILIDTVDAPVLANVTECVTGSTVNGIYLKVEAYATSTAALANFYIMIFKNPGSNLSSIPNPNVVGASDQKRYVFHQEMVMMEKNTTGNPRTVFNGVIVIPKHFRRNAPDDNIAIKVLAPGVSADFCIQCHYKEFR